MAQLFAKKRAMQQVWTKTGKRLPVTVLLAKGNVVLSTSVNETTMIGFGETEMKKLAKPQSAELAKLGVKQAVKSRKKMMLQTEAPIGSEVKLSDVFSVGDVVDVTGTSKGTGFTGVVKRHNFKGGPRTHGQSDRERAPGSIGNRTTPGRVFKGKRMAGRSGGATVTVENMRIVFIDDVAGEIWVDGPVAGARTKTVVITKVQSGKFEGLMEKAGKKAESAEVTEAVEPAVTPEAEPAETVVEPVAEPVAETAEAAPAADVKTEEVKEEPAEAKKEQE
jgi:large subunit ribosomal protein L3